MQKISNDEVISKKQYTLKLKPMYFALTRLNVFAIVLCFILLDSKNFLMFYPPIAFLLYRFCFKETKLSNPYTIFLFKHWGRFIRILRGIK
ncbi:hypothetical protein [Helicobacter turcicus]|uniref:Cag pathogenicity island protein n=1 Tax=Helicobacter turcicus TaxID=2867412 RepID=A0ABS7JPE9_9HELI|nr:hypothetical protein [Helicobacter turcicus]MBX7491247.1 hypothetical protein [Helicobacter turcicus]MBX7546114.1 hypothetical protein [Helicobacter turcicus]